MNEASPTVPSGREHGLDALRVFAFLILILYHSGMGYVSSWEWHVKNPETSSLLQYPMNFVNRWRLPLLFFISGAGVAFSLGRRTYVQFARERLVRLLLPLVFGMLVIVPPQVYIERLSEGRNYDSYWQFWLTVLEGVPYPKGSLSWHHLWFVAYVLVYALASIPVFRLLRSPAGARWLAGLAEWLENNRGAVYLLNAPNLAVGLLLGPHWPVTHNLVSDWANLTGSWLTFLWGFVFASDRRLLDVITRRRREFLAVGLLLTVVLFGPRPRGAAGTVVSGYYTMAWILTLLGFARVTVTAPSAALRYANEAVYPFYIFHQTITVALVALLAPVQAGVALKWMLAASGTFVGSWLAYEGIRRLGPLRPLVGLRRSSRIRIDSLCQN